MSNTQRDASKGALLVLFLVTMIDLIGFGIVIPFLTYLVEDLADSQGIVEVGIWVGILMTSHIQQHNSYFHQFGVPFLIELEEDLY